MAPTSKRAWKLQEFVAHGASVTCLALGRKSGRVMVTGGEDKKVNLWAVGKPNCIMSLTGHTTSVECVKFGHSEDLVCAGSASGTLKVWDLEAAKIVRTLTGHKANVRCLDFHPSGDFMASGSLDTSIKLWDIRRKGCIFTYKGHSKDVYCLKFSPDGRWVASGGDEGTVKLWDLPAGKMLTEFKGHSSSVTDVEFHPNEFLLASASSDRTVKFWDLESFQLVSATEGDSGPVRCIHFHPDGGVLFSGAQDHLRVYGWEPARNYDSLVMGWGKVTDITVSDSQLIAGTYSLTNVSIYVVDLKKVQPFAQTPGQTQPYYVYDNSDSNREELSRKCNRKSFNRGRPDNNQSRCMPMESGEPDQGGAESDPTDALSLAEIKDEDDYNEIFHPSRELSRTPPKPDPFPAPAEDIARISDLSMPRVSDASALRVVRPTEKTMPSHFAPLPDKSSVSIPRSIPEKIPGPAVSSIAITSSLNTTYTKSTFTKISSSSSLSLSKSSAPNVSPVKPMEKATAMFRQKAPFPESPTAAVSVVRPVEREVPPPQRAVVFPEQQRITEPVFQDFVPDQREAPAGLDMEEFLPRHLQDTLRLGIPMKPEMNETEAMSNIFQGHKSMVTVLMHRRKNLQIILALWSSKDVKTAMESALQMNDNAVLVDILNVITLKSSVWSLDLCQIILPHLQNLLESKYESYVTVGCSALKLILKNFATVIKSNISAPPGIGVDITREERYNKCMSCLNHLLSLRAFVMKRQTLQGKLGRSFRELMILMQNLE